MSGGVNNIARIKNKIIRYGRILVIWDFDFMPVRIRRLVIIGTWKAKPNPKINFIMKLKYWLISVIIFILDGALDTKNFVITGATTR